MSGAAYDNRVWLVTGASKGIGRCVVEAALAAGHTVAAASRDVRGLTRWAEEGGLTDRILPIELEVTDPSGAEDVVRQVKDQLGRIDVLVNNAGYLLYGGIEELSDAEVQRSFGVNVFGLLNVTRAVLPFMREQGGGRVINLASISADVTFPSSGLYSATKAAVLMLTEALADEGREVGVRATAICPGGVRTDFLDGSSARRAETVIDAYQAVHRAEESLMSGNHRQGGDPRRVADAIVEVAGMAEPPRRLYLGEDALAAVARSHTAVMEELDRHRSLSTSISV